MKILFWSDGFWPNIGGVETLASQFIPAMQERGHEFCIVTSHIGEKLPDQTTYEGNMLYRFHFYRALEKKDLKEIKIISDRIKNIKLSFNPDLIHMNFTGVSPFFHQRSRTPNEAPTLTTIHGLPALSASGPMMAQTLMNSHWVIAVSESMREDAMLIAPPIKEKSSVIYNSLKKPSLSPTALNFDDQQLLCIGRLSKEKGFDIALKALPEVLRVFPKAHLVIAGDGPERSALEEISSDLGLEEHVSFAGWITPENIYGLINQSCIVIVPSRWNEPFCLVALEAAHMGRPVIASRTGALPEVVLHDETGILFDNENVESLANSVIFLLKNRAAGEAMGSRGRKRANEVFAWDQCIDSYESLYHQIVNDHHKDLND